MRKSSSQLTKLYIVIITLLILLIPFYLYYTFYVSSERAYLTNRNFRLLTTIGNLVKTTIERFDDILKKESNKAFKFSVEDFRNGITAEALYEEIKKDHNDVKEVILSSSDFQDGEFGDTFFREDEFEKDTSVEALCKAISEDEFNITVEATKNTIAWLNELLVIPNFYEIFVKKKSKDFNFNSKEIPRLIGKMKGYQDNKFSDLSKDMQETIPILNRLILEEGYPKQTPNINTITTESLCASINTAILAYKGNVRLPSKEENSLEWLNKLLKVPNLYSVLYINKENEIKKINPFAFRTEEFKDDGANLCKAIFEDKPDFFGVAKAKNNTIEQLNKLLEIPKFCKKFVKKNQKFSKEITQLIEKTEGYQDKQFSDLSKDKQETITLLNRLILKEGYPELTPEVYRNFDELIRLSNETERYLDKQLSDLSKDELVRLSNETEECRNKKNIFYDMNNINELRKVQRFNRLLLEFTYPIKTPKIEMGVSEAAYNHALNEILKEPGFYDRCKKKDTLPNLSKNIQRLVDDTQGYRDVEFTKLEENQKNSVIQLNRLIIEEIYQKKCPKWNEEVKARLEAIPSFTIVDTPGIKKIDADTKLPISIKNIENMYWLNFNYTPNLGNNSYGVNIKVQTNLGELVGSLVNEKVFDEVMLINQDDGSVIFRYGSLSENFEKFDTLTNQEGKDIKFASVNPPTSLCNINLAGVLYNLYLQPVKFLLFSDEVSKELNTGRWVVCGFARSDRFNRESRSLSLNYIIAFTTLIVFVFLSWPFIKLWLMGSSDRLKISDICFMFFSLVMGSCLLCIVFLDGYAYYNVREETDNQLKEFSDQIHKNFKEELVSAVRQLDKLNYNGELKRSIRGMGVNEREKISKTSIFKNLGVQADFYPYFDRIAWIDNEGEQRIKWCIGKQQSRFISVKEFSYFIKAVNDQFWDIKDKDEIIHRFCLESIDTKTTGEKFAIISIAMPERNVIDTGAETDDSQKAPKNFVIAAMVTRFQSLFQTVFPPGYGYCIVDQGGKVLFHCEEVKNSNEDFFAETDNNQNIRSLVFHRMCDWVNGYYYGKDRRFYIRPISDLPWSLIVYHDKDNINIANFSILITSTVFYYLYLFIPLLVVGFGFLIVFLYRILSGRVSNNEILYGKASWIWPNTRQVKNYNKLFISNVLLGALLCGMSYCCNERLVVFLPVLIFIEIAFIYFWLKRDGLPNDKRATSHFTEQHLCMKYVIVVFSLLMIMVIIPSYIFFKTAYDMEKKLFIKNGQFHLAKNVEDRKERITAQYKKINIGNDDKDRDDFVQKRLDEKWDMYNSFYFNTNINIDDGSLNFYVGEFVLPWTVEGLCYDIVHKKKPDIGFSNLEIYEQNLEEAYPQETPKILHENVLQQTRHFLGKILNKIYILSNQYNRFVYTISNRYNQFSTDLCMLSSDASADKLWNWEQRLEGRLVLNRERYKDVKQRDTILRISSIIPTFVDSQNYSWLKSIIIPILLLILFIAALFFIIESIAHKVFLLHLNKPVGVKSLKETLGEGSISQNLLVIRTQFDTNYKPLDVNGFAVFDMKEKARKAECQGDFLYKEYLEENGKIFIDNFNYKKDDPNLNLKKLQLLEELLIHNERIVVVSSVHPEGFSLNVQEDKLKERKIEQEEVLLYKAAERWKGIFKSFLIIYDRENEEVENFQKKIDVCEKCSEGFCQVIKNECKPRKYLQNIGIKILSQYCPKVYTPAEVLQIISEEAHAYYQALWDIFSKDEKRTLYYLAKDGFLSSKNVHIQQLLKSGIIVLENGFRLMNESFRRFIILVSQPSHIIEWQKTADSSWNMIRIPFMIVLISVAAFLSFTQKELLQSSIAIIATIATTIPSIFKLFDLLQNNKSNVAKKS